MLVGNVFEKTDAQTAWQLCADKAADWVRTCWLDHMRSGDRQWEETNVEDPAALVGLREEGFAGLVGMDYLFKWWGAEDGDGLAGVFEAIWKIAGDEGDAPIACYRTWIKLAERDFVLGLHQGEGAKRDANRNAFREAFSTWRDIYTGRR